MIERVSPDRAHAHLLTLTQEIGVRLAGSDGERTAAEYIAGRFAETGATVSTEEFPVFERAVRNESLEVLIDGRWTAFSCSLLSNTPGTNTSLSAPPRVPVLPGPKDGTTPSMVQ